MPLSRGMYPPKPSPSRRFRALGAETVRVRLLLSRRSISQRPSRRRLRDAKEAVARKHLQIQFLVRKIANLEPVPVSVQIAFSSPSNTSPFPSSTIRDGFQCRPAGRWSKTEPGRSNPAPKNPSGLRCWLLASRSGSFHRLGLKSARPIRYVAIVDCAIQREEITGGLKAIADWATSDNIRCYPPILDGVSRKLWIAIQRSAHSKSKFGSFARLQVRL